MLAKMTTRRATPAVPAGLALAADLAKARQTVLDVVDRLDEVERERALEFVVSAYDPAIDKWFQNGDLVTPRLTTGDSGTVHAPSVPSDFSVEDVPTVIVAAPQS